MMSQKIFVAKDFENIGIFHPFTSNTTIAHAITIKPELLKKLMPIYKPFCELCIIGS